MQIEGYLMDLSNLKNIDVNDLFNKLKSGGLADKKLLIKFGIGFGAVLIFLIIYYIFVSPKIAAQEEKIKIMNENYKEGLYEFDLKIFESDSIDFFYIMTQNINNLHSLSFDVDSLKQEDFESQNFKFHWIMLILETTSKS